MKIVKLFEKQKCGKCNMFIKKGDLAFEFNNRRRGVVYKHKDEETCNLGFAIKQLKK